MIKADIAANVSREAGTTLAQAEYCVDVILKALKAGLVQRGRIELRGFGVFVVRARKLGIGRNPRTGESFPITPGRTVRFNAGKILRDLPTAE